MRWLLANEDPTSLNWTATDKPAVEIKTIPGLSGYLLATGALVESVPVDVTTSDTVGTMFLAVPLVPGRDLYDLDFSMRGGEGTSPSAVASCVPRRRFPRLCAAVTTLPSGRPVTWRGTGFPTRRRCPSQVK